jgi:hypothetical protein
MEMAFKTMDDGYKVVEDLIVAFYEPDTIDFTHLAGSNGIQDKQMEAAYTIYHMLLAGNFFEETDRYLKAIKALRDPQMIEKYMHLKDHADEEHFQSACTIPEAAISA